MKKIATLIIAFIPLLGMAQKEVKPSTSKAEKALKEGKLDEAKAIIDATTSSNEFMVDKKGKPSKSAASAWFLKGLIYAAIDTTSNQTYKALEANPFPVAAEAFKKSDEIDKGEHPSFINDSKSLMPIPNAQLKNMLSQAYTQKSLNAYNKDKDYKKAFKNLEEALYFTPEDTALIMYAGVYFGPSAEEYDKSLDYINKYIAKGGKNYEAWLQAVSIYVDKKKDNVNALKAIQAGEARFPKNEDFPKYELNIYLADKRYADARKFVVKSLKSNPNDASSYYMLGQLYDRTNAPDSARIAFQKAIDLEPTNFDATLELARSYYAEGRRIKQMRDKLGISASDIAQRKQLLDKQRAEYKVALPYWEKAEKMKPEDQDVLFTLSDIYSSLVMDDQQARVEKKIKQLGYDK